MFMEIWEPILLAILVRISAPVDKKKLMIVINTHLQSKSPSAIVIREMLLLDMMRAQLPIRYLPIH